MQDPRWTRRRAAIACGLPGLALLACTHLTPPPGSAARAEAQCRARHPDAPAEHAFTTDGCSAWPDGVWQDCCIEHDEIYWCGGSSEERAEADQALRRCVAEHGHGTIGWLMWSGVRVGGVPFLPLPWRWGYGKPWPTLYTHPPSCRKAR